MKDQLEAVRENEIVEWMASDDGKLLSGARSTNAQKHYPPTAWDVAFSGSE